MRGWDVRPTGGLMPEKRPSDPVDLSPLVQIAYPNYGFMTGDPAVVQAVYDTTTAGRNIT